MQKITITQLIKQLEEASRMTSTGRTLRSVGDAEDVPMDPQMTVDNPPSRPTKVESPIGIGKTIDYNGMRIKREENTLRVIDLKRVETAHKVDQFVLYDLRYATSTADRLLVANYERNLISKRWSFKQARQQASEMVLYLSKVKLQQDQVRSTDIDPSEDAV